MSIRSALSLHLNRKRLTALEWKQKDDRDQGPATDRVRTARAMATRTSTRAPTVRPSQIHPMTAMRGAAAKMPAT